jgi:hypothetical protein
MKFLLVSFSADPSTMEIHKRGTLIVQKNDNSDEFVCIGWNLVSCVRRWFDSIFTVVEGRRSPGSLRRLRSRPRDQFSLSCAGDFQGAGVGRSGRTVFGRRRRKLLPHFGGGLVRPPCVGTICIIWESAIPADYRGKRLFFESCLGLRLAFGRLG